MLTFLLIIIYISFISLGLPDSLLGSGWSAMYPELSVPFSWAGILSMIIACGTVISSLFSAKIIQKFGTGLVTAISVAMTAIALIGFDISHQFVFLILFAVPLGLGAGSVDAALNNYVALHFEARHMNWLHCFWGIGASLSPVIMAFWLKKNGNWNLGYLTVGFLQAALVVVLFATLPIWKKAVNSADNFEESEHHTTISLKNVIKISGAKAALIGFFCYCSVESITGLWAGSYAVGRYDVSAQTAATWTSIYYLGITLGRMIAGFVSMKINNRNLIRIGQAFIGLGILLLLIPIGVYKIPVALILIGTGCAPIYPAMLHQTPQVFGKQISQAMMGVQMACAYVGVTIMPPLFGFLAEHISLSLFPIYLLFFIILMSICSEKVNRCQAVS